uniref:Retrotransposon protein, putative, unclassified n=1 Tax=Oryza sativa subsp. japonica TaxID=39947 RepID=Q2QRP1_ORYSJ|nr:retrotransposon protein, putative, unclassified [Oryza sativa Japonica Group]
MDISRANEGYTGCGSVVEMSWHRAGVLLLGAQSCLPVSGVPAVGGVGLVLLSRLGWVKGLCHILYDGFHDCGMRSKDVSCGLAWVELGPGSGFQFGLNHRRPWVKAGAELLQRIINKAFLQGLLSKPINESSGDGFPIIQYVDDILILLKASQREVFCFKAILNMFAQSTGLKVNFNKSSLYPLNLSQDKADLLAGILGCNIGSLPFTYLGLPLGTTRHRVVDFAPLVDRIERRLTASSIFLPQGGRLTLINSVISSIPTYYMSSLQLPVTVIKAIDTARKNYLWRGNNPSSTRKSLASWDRVCTLKRKEV